MSVPMVSYPLGTLIRELREAQRLTQTDVAAWMGLEGDSGRVTVGQWETGSRVPPPALLPRLAACLGCWPIDGSPALRLAVAKAALELSYPLDHQNRGA